MKEQILKELKKKDFLSQSIMLNWLRSQTNITFDKEERFNELLKDMIIEEVSQVISQTREETISNIFKFMREYIKENEKLGNGNRVIIADELYAKISILIDNL